VKGLEKFLLMRPSCTACNEVNARFVVRTIISFPLRSRPSICDCLLPLAVVGRIRFAGTNAFVMGYDCIVNIVRVDASECWKLRALTMFQCARTYCEGGQCSV
jgi:hypothetical protein